MNLAKNNSKNINSFFIKWSKMLGSCRNFHIMTTHTKQNLHYPLGKVTVTCRELQYHNYLHENNLKKPSWTKPHIFTITPLPDGHHYMINIDVKVEQKSQTRTQSYTVYKNLTMPKQ